MPKFIPVIFHNLEGYDSHLFIKNLGVTEGNIKCIPKNEEKYTSFTKNIVVDKPKTFCNTKCLRFIDSFKFMPSSLGKLVDNLDRDKFHNTSKYFQGEKLNLVLRKGVYSYDYVDCLEKLDETKLPPKEAFYSKLNDEDISHEDYEHAQKVWKVFGMKTMRDYHDLYLKTDVLLLTDVFEEFRKVCLDNYKLDPAWYYTSAGLSWDAILKLTKVKLEPLTDSEMYLMAEKGIRGGVSMISNRFSKANNPYMRDKYDPNSPTKYIPYLDANNLYGYAMSKPLPVRNFKWMTEEDLNNWRNIPCILEVDLEYPQDLHDLYNDYPLGPERLKIGKVEKRIPNLYNKEKYVLHRQNLKQYESFGLKITKIHKGITFHEEPWLAKYISLNTELRTKAKNDFEKDFFKLINNSVFGKTMENLRNRVDVCLVTSEVKARKLFAKPNYMSRTIFSDNLIAVHMKKTKLKLNKPIYLGMSILYLSKTLMYDFHYNYIKPKYDNKAKLLFTDTDSLAYEIETEDFYKDIAPDVESMFDTSNYPKIHKSGILTGKNKKVLGVFKDECGGKQIDEFVGLRAKSYSYTVEDSERSERGEASEEKKCKGVKKNVIEEN